MTLFSEQRVLTCFSEKTCPNKRYNSNWRKQAYHEISAYTSADKDNITHDQTDPCIIFGIYMLNTFYYTFEDPAMELSSAADCVFMLLKNAGFNLVWDVRLEKGAVRLSCTFSKAGKNISHIIWSIRERKKGRRTTITTWIFTFVQTQMNKLCSFRMARGLQQRWDPTFPNTHRKLMWQGPP